MRIFATIASLLAIAGAAGACPTAGAFYTPAQAYSTPSYGYSLRAAPQPCQTPVAAPMMPYADDGGCQAPAASYAPSYAPGYAQSYAPGYGQGYTPSYAYGTSYLNRTALYGAGHGYNTAFARQRAFFTPGYGVGFSGGTFVRQRTFAPGFAPAFGPGVLVQTPGALVSVGRQQTFVAAPPVAVVGGGAVFAGGGRGRQVIRTRTVTRGRR